MREPGVAGAFNHIAGVLPPFVEERSWGRDHCCNEDEEIDLGARANERCGEAAERMAHHDEVLTLPGCTYHGVGKLPPTGRGILARQIDRHRLVPAFPQLGPDRMPVSSASAAAVDQRERGYDFRC